VAQNNHPPPPTITVQQFPLPESPSHGSSIGGSNSNSNNNSSSSNNAPLDFSRAYSNDILVQSTSSSADLFEEKSHTVGSGGGGGGGGGGGASTTAATTTAFSTSSASSSSSFSWLRKQAEREARAQYSSSHHSLPAVTHWEDGVVKVRTLLQMHHHNHQRSISAGGSHGGSHGGSRRRLLRLMQSVHERRDQKGPLALGVARVVPLSVSLTSLYVTHCGMAHGTEEDTG
jgi:hypothetical protein